MDNQQRPDSGTDAGEYARSEGTRNERDRMRDVDNASDAEQTPGKDAPAVDPGVNLENE